MRNNNHRCTSNTVWRGKRLKECLGGNWVNRFNDGGWEVSNLANFLLDSCRVLSSPRLCVSDRCC